VTRAPALLGILSLAGCAYVGAPKPPALAIPTRITDLRAAEYGDKIIVEFTIGMDTTEGLKLSAVKAVEARVAVGSTSQIVPLPAKPVGPVDYDFPARDWVGKNVVVTVRATGPKGKAGDWSNPVSLTIGAPLATPENVQAVSDPQGVRLTWLGPANGHYRIFRGAGEMMPLRLAESDKPEYIDTTVDFGSPYRYFAQALAGELQQSEVSATVAVTPVDTFPPAVPVGLMAVAAVNSIELVWQRNTEDDFAGYHVYRSTDGGPPQPIAGPLDAPTFSDRTVEIGKKYSYTVTATDRNGNESAHSAPAEAVAQ
jgi:fibronectin type 3 domain-containing protein